ncbi:tax1-binding protein 3-like [Antedon mediterranea]|uniref:tax1-binding protein 3-like n=1 Tax=Antedon mediterranea TaxID=105859 RepID=UPI003AF8323D
MSFVGSGIPCVEITVVKNPGLGFSIAGGIDQDASKNPFSTNDKGIFVTKVASGGPAEVGGLQVGDKILEVNGYDVTMATHKHAVKLLSKEKETQVMLKVTRPSIIRGR